MVAVRDLGGDAVEEADVLVVQIDVDEAAQLAAVDQALLDPGVPGLQVGEELGERGPAALDRLLAVGVGAEDGRDADLDGHVWAPVGGRGGLPDRERPGGRRRRASGVSGARSGGHGAARTHRAGEPAQVDVEPRHEQRARRLLAHVIENHELIVSIPDPAPGSLSRDTDG